MIQCNNIRYQYNWTVNNDLICSKEKVNKEHEKYNNKLKDLYGLLLVLTIIANGLPSKADRTNQGNLPYKNSLT